MDHLLNRYGNILPSDIMENKITMDEPLDAALPINLYFKRIDECVQFATNAENPFTPLQICKLHIMLLHLVVCTLLHVSCGGKNLAGV